MEEILGERNTPRKQKEEVEKGSGREEVVGETRKRERIELN